MEEKASPLNLPSAYALGMKQQPGYKWWKPIVAALLAFALMIGFTVVLTIIYVVAVVVLTGSTDVTQLSAYLLGTDDSSTGSYLNFDGDDALSLAFTLGCTALMLPSVGLANKIMGLGGFGRLSSVEGKLRWGRIAALAPWALLVAALMCAIELGLAVATGENLGTPRFALAAIIVVIIICPLQCAAEEYLCRGFLMQTFSSWIPMVVIPLILQAIIFTLMHGYSILGLIGVGITGLIAGYLTLKTGGLEAGICLHSANNVLSFMLSAIFPAMETQSTIDITSFVLDLIINVLFLVVLYVVCKRKGYLLAD